MTSAELFDRPATLAVGAGRLTLDVIVHQGDPPALARSQAGGTCGNVLADLAYLGWQCYPLTDLGDDDAGRRFLRDLARWGVRLDLIRCYPDQQTPVIVHHIRQSESGAVHSFSSRCPFCDHRLRYYEPVPLPRVEERLAAVPTAQVYFFDRDSPGTLLLARHQRQRGAVVVYEPNYAGPESDLPGALAQAHILKFAREKLPGLADRPLVGPWLVIETLGADGLRFRDQRAGFGEWVHLPALPVAVVRDAAGSGDWCTAGLLHVLAREGAAGLQRASVAQWQAALRFGMALAAWNCAFEGARGGVYCVDRPTFERDVGRLLAGECFDPAESAGPSTQDEAGAFCPNCAAALQREGDLMKRTSLEEGSILDGI
jgi:sugar/nucleoside kinase (ribokinase family)